MHEQKQDLAAFGFWVYILSDCVLFSGLFAAYAVLHGESFGGVGPQDIFHLSPVLIETMFLLTSSFMCGMALLDARAGKKRATLLALLFTLILGWAFLGMELSEFSSLIHDGHSFTQSAFLSSFFALVGTHGLHVALGSLWMLVLMISIYMRGLTASNTRKLVLFSLFWHFLDIIWIFIFTFVYLVGLL